MIGTIHVHVVMRITRRLVSSFRSTTSPAPDTPPSTNRPRCVPEDTFRSTTTAAATTNPTAASRRTRRPRVNRTPDHAASARRNVGTNTITEPKSAPADGSISTSATSHSRQPAATRPSVRSGAESIHEPARSSTAAPRIANPMLPMP